MTPSSNVPRCAPRLRGSLLHYVVAAALVALAIALLVTGCAGLPQVVDSLARDTNSVTVRLTTIHGSLDYRRNAPASTMP
jgi:hypothetical protein